MVVLIIRFCYLCRLGGLVGRCGVFMIFRSFFGLIFGVFVFFFVVILFLVLSFFCCNKLVMILFDNIIINVYIYVSLIENNL